MEVRVSKQANRAVIVAPDNAAVYLSTRGVSLKLLLKWDLIFAAFPKLNVPKLAQKSELIWSGFPCRKACWRFYMTYSGSLFPL